MDLLQSFHLYLDEINTISISARENSVISREGGQETEESRGSGDLHAQYLHIYHKHEALKT